MFRKIIFGSILVIATVFVLSGSSMAAVTDAADNATGSFVVTVNGGSVDLKASANVSISISLDTAVTTSATIAAVNSKGSRMFAMDSDGGPLYYSSVDVGTSTVSAIDSTPGTDDVAALGTWTAL